MNRLDPARLAKYRQQGSSARGKMSMSCYKWQLRYNPDSTQEGSAGLAINGRSVGNIWEGLFSMAGLPFRKKRRK